MRGGVRSRKANAVHPPARADALHSFSSPRRFLTTAEVAEHLKCSRSHVHAPIAAGVLPAWKPSPRKTLIPIGALDRIEDAVLAGVSDAALERAFAARHGTRTGKGARDA